MAEPPPFPPIELAVRVGSPAGGDDPYFAFERDGRRLRDAIVSELPAGWSFEGKRVLDFGCGSGRVLRHFLAEARIADFHGCDIDRYSIAWLDEHLSPPLHVFISDEHPPLPRPDGSFDLIYAMSVFTHLTDTWAQWLLEMHRLLAPDGLLIATFIGPAVAAQLNQHYHEDKVGANVLGIGKDWDSGGPVVLHSKWWLRAHWGRAFDILELRAGGFRHAGTTGGDGDCDQGVIVMRRREVSVTPEELERPEPDEPRELAAARFNIKQLGRESAWLYDELQALKPYAKSERAARHQLEQRLAEREETLRALQQRLGELERSERAIASSRSWRLLKPARAVAAVLRARGRAGPS